MEKGVCRLSVVPIRTEPADQAEIGSQLLFGDHYSVRQYSDDRKWVAIENYFDAYQGWICAKQHYAISEEYFNQINLSDYRISTELIANVLFKKKNFPIVMGSVLPVSTNELFDTEEHLAFSGSTKSLSARRDYDFLKEIAMKYLHAPYLWGGKSPFGIDCSGLSQVCLKICGYNIKRDARDQAKQGISIGKLADAKPGDLAFFDKNGQVTHVGILLEDHKIIHASGHVRIDKLDEKGIFNESKKIYTHQLYGIKRFLK